MRLGDTPVPIPNTTVKTQSADGTALETVWESRWAPDQKENNRRKPDKISGLYQWLEILNMFKKKKDFLFFQVNYSVMFVLRQQMMKI